MSNNTKRVLLESYMLFYNDVPKLKNELDQEKMQIMTYILTHYDIWIDDSYKFTCLRKGNYPSSINLSLDMVDMVSSKPVMPLILQEKYSKIIKIIGEEINNYISSYSNKRNALIMLSRVYYYSDNILLDNKRKYDEIKKAFKYTNEDISKILELKEKIKTLTMKKD